MGVSVGAGNEVARVRAIGGFASDTAAAALWIKVGCHKHNTAARGAAISRKRAGCRLGPPGRGVGRVVASSRRRGPWAVPTRQKPHATSDVVPPPRIKRNPGGPGRCQYQDQSFNNKAVLLYKMQLHYKAQPPLLDKLFKVR